MDEGDLALEVGEVRERLEHAPVEPVRAQRAPEDEHGERLVLIPGPKEVLEQPPADRVPEELRVRGEGHPGRVERNEGRVDHVPQQAVGEAGQRVLLLHRRGDAHEPGRQHHRARRVPPHPDDDVRGVAPKERHGRGEGPGHRQEPQKELRGAHALEAARRDGLEAKAVLGHHPGLDAAVGADEDDVVLRVT